MMASEEQKHPVNLLDRILQKCQQISLTKKNCEEKTEDVLVSEEDKEEEEVEPLSPDDPSSIVDRICCSDGTQSVATKLKLLTFLTDVCKSNPSLYETVGDSPLVYLAETLLFDYSKQRGEQALVIPMLELLTLSANMRIEKMRIMFLHESHLLLRLMQAAVLCSYNMATTLKELQEQVLNKNLVGAQFKMEAQEVKQLFTSCLGFEADVKLEGCHLTLFEVSDTKEVNINLKFTGIKASSELENVDSAKWSDIVVSRVTYLKTLFVYTKEDWRGRLTTISDNVKKTLQKVDVSEVHKHQTGAMYGFWSSDMEMEGQPLQEVPCLRGQLLSLNGDWAMLWIVDLGLLGFIPKAKLYPLSQELVELSWLISICLFRGPMCQMDEEFLKAAYKLLCIVVETNVQIGKHMLLFETGHHILNLIEYPEPSVRLAVFSLLLCLAKNSRDVVKFLMEQQYDHILLGKLETYAHAYTGCLVVDKEAMDEEIKKMLMILLVILEQREDVRSWADNRRASRVMWMYLCERRKGECRELLEKCLSALTTPTQQPNSRNRQQFHKRYNSSGEIQNRSENERGQWRGRREHGYRRSGQDSGYRRWNRRHTQSRDTDRGCCDDSPQTGEGTRAGTDVNKLDFHPRLPVLNRLERPTIIPNTVSATYHSLLDDCDDAPPTVEVKEEHQVSLEAEVDYVVYGTVADVKWDKTHEVILSKKLWDMKEVVLAQKLCGLLNNNVEGSMFFGLTHDLIIEGIWFGHGEKDTFRNGIDRIMNRCLIPEVRANSYDIIFTPVLRPDDKLTDLNKQSLFIVEIRVQPLVHMVYMVYQNRKCYVRNGTDTVECTVAQRKLDIMDEEERSLEECIQELQATANNNLAALAKLIKKHVSDLDS